MHQQQHRIRSIAIAFLTALSVTAISGPAAQAGEFRVGGETFAGAGIEQESVQGSLGLSQFTVPWLGLGIHCEGGTLAGIIYQGGAVFAEVQITGCVIEETTFCTLYPSKKDLEETTNPGTTVSASAGEVIVHNETHYVEFANEAFNTVYIGGAFCPLPEEMLASGSLAIESPSALIELVSQPFVAINKETEKLLGVSLFCSGEPASVLGNESLVQLSGANSGETWSFE